MGAFICKGVQSTVLLAAGRRACRPASHHAFNPHAKNDTVQMVRSGFVERCIIVNELEPGRWLHGRAPRTQRRQSASFCYSQLVLVLVVLAMIGGVRHYRCRWSRGHYHYRWRRGHYRSVEPWSLQPVTHPHPGTHRLECRDHRADENRPASNGQKPVIGTNRNGKDARHGPV